VIRFSKYRFFYLFSFLPLLLTSCGKASNDIIPDVFIDFTIDLLDPEFVNLAVINAADTIDETTNNWGYKSAGYDNNGIIVFSGPDDYYAFDRTCPHDFSETGSSIKIKLESNIYAVCPKCNTKYSLSTYGTPISGPGKYPLKNYKTNFDGDRFIRVWNE
jgi:nitrite reductase/ring-hydroxylating ferredoxin subunit